MPKLSTVHTSHPQLDWESATFNGADLVFHDWPEIVNRHEVDLVTVEFGVLDRHKIITIREHNQAREPRETIKGKHNCRMWISQISRTESKSTSQDITVPLMGLGSKI